MTERELERPDSPCECCGRLSPRLAYDEGSKLLLCPPCEYGMRHQRRQTVRQGVKSQGIDSRAPGRHE